ncbi:hypothetical protein UPYG_G00114090 [Umbra pygmaea]|uniref:Uncharacterized protein n=1 Tax=Umbra pygmaea TaxID=75934 RepID=A0ABD0X6Z8_UMBPY
MPPLMQVCVTWRGFTFACSKKGGLRIFSWLSRSCTMRQGHYEALNAVFQKVGLPDWKEKLVGLGSDGAPVMVSELRGLYKQFHYSPKAWRELKALSEVLQKNVWKPTNLGGTRSASADMIGRAKQCVQVLMNYSQLFFIVLVQDILKVLSCLSLKFQEDGVTLKALLAFETAVLMLTNIHTAHGEILEGFLKESAGGQFHAVQLQNFCSESRDRFDRVKSQLLESVIESLTTRFKDLEMHRILQAAAKLVDPRDEAELASYGVEHLRVVTDHFAGILVCLGCDGSGTAPGVA